MLQIFRRVVWNKIYDDDDDDNVSDADNGLLLLQRYSQSTHPSKQLLAPSRRPSQTQYPQYPATTVPVPPLHHPTTADDAGTAGTGNLTANAAYRRSPGNASVATATAGARSSNNINVNSAQQPQYHHHRYQQQQQQQREQERMRRKLVEWCKLHPHRAPAVRVPRPSRPQHSLSPARR